MLNRKARKNKIQEEREESDAARGKEFAKPVKQTRRSKVVPLLRKVKAPEKISKISASRLTKPAAASEEEDLFSELEEPVQSLWEAQEASDLIRAILNVASEPNLYPLVIDRGSGRDSRAEDFDALKTWRVPPADLLFLHAALVDKISEIRVKAASRRKTLLTVRTLLIANPRQGVIPRGVRATCSPSVNLGHITNRCLSPSFRGRLSTAGYAGPINRKFRLQRRFFPTWLGRRWK